MNAKSALLSATDFFHRLTVGNMDDHRLGANDFSKTDRPVCRLTFHRDRPRGAMEERRSLAFVLQPVGEIADGVITFGMHHHKGLMPPRNIQHGQNILVGKFHVIIGHEDLDRGVTLSDQRRQFLAKDMRRRVGDNQVKCDVCMAIALGLGLIASNRLPQRLPLLLQAERQNRGVAADCR